MMLATRLILLLAVVGVSANDPGALVRRLGSPKYTDREVASAALAKLGVQALPALKSAKADPDAEIRSRAGELVERIEIDVMVHPTLVNLDFQGESLANAINALAERGHTSLVLSDRSSHLRSRPITLIQPEPVPFWTAVELLGKAAGVELSGGSSAMGMGLPMGRLAPLTLFATPQGAKLPPVAVSGPFRASLLNITHYKERAFGGNHVNPGMIGFAPNPGNVPPPVRPMGPGLPNETTELFSAQLQIQSEPRLNVALTGPVKLLEAVDDHGNSLIPSGVGGNGFQHFSGYNQYEVSGTSTIQTALPLRFPEKPGKTIRRLRGTVPILVTARKDDPLMIPLASAKGNTYHASDASLTVHEVKVDPNLGQTVIDLTIRSTTSVDPNLGGFGANFAVFRGVGQSLSPFEIIDAKGQPIPRWDSIGQTQTADGVRLQIRLMPNPTDQATHIRYFEISRANTEAEFEFLDVDMP